MQKTSVQPRVGKIPREGMWLMTPTCSRIPWQRNSGGLQSMWSESNMIEQPTGLESVYLLHVPLDLPMRWWVLEYSFYGRKWRFGERRLAVRRIQELGVKKKPESEGVHLTYGSHFLSKILNGVKAFRETTAFQAFIAHFSGTQVHACDLYANFRYILSLK